MSFFFVDRDGEIQDHLGARKVKIKKGISLIEYIPCVFLYSNMYLDYFTRFFLERVKGPFCFSLG